MAVIAELKRLSQKKKKNNSLSLSSLWLLSESLCNKGLKITLSSTEMFTKKHRVLLRQPQASKLAKCRGQGYDK